MGRKSKSVISVQSNSSGRRIFSQLVMGKLLNSGFVTARKIQSQMNIILATDPMFWPLTGIGRYTHELIKHLDADPRVGDVRYFNMGRWQNKAEFARFEHYNDAGAAEPDRIARGFGLLRKSLANNKLATKTYSYVTPPIYAQRLKPFSKSHIYHSPNFLLPPFAGKKVATFLDLSVFRHPEFHPKARVPLLRPETAKAARNADHIITPTEAVRQEVIEYFSRSADDVSAVPLASSFHDFRPEYESIERFLHKHRLGNRQFFLFVSSIEPRKNINRLLDAYESLAPDFKKQYPLVLTGSSGWQSEDVLARIATLAQSGQVRYLGYTSETGLMHLYATAGAVVFPSIYEGFGLPIIEAQAMGVPVVTSDVSCMPEVAGGAALLVDPFDISSIGDALLRIMNDDSLRRDLKEKGLKNASQYSWAKTVSKTIDVYSHL